MRKCFAVIGANYGDESKGRVVDQLVLKHDAQAVCRFSSGPQAGHTVVLPCGYRHVFGHIGSGALRGVPTYLASDFLVNPQKLASEMDKLLIDGYDTDVYVRDNCLVTTAFDVALNWLAERRRGMRHGSCLMGINETMVRSKTHPITVSDIALRGFEYAASLIKLIRTQYVPARLRGLGIAELSETEKAFINNIFENEDDVAYAKQLVDWLSRAEIVSREFNLPDRTIFEGSQGLGLDKDMGTFPHVTHASTGYSGISGSLLEQFTDRELTYVTRSYLTRHGAGPMESENESMQYHDSTNVPNEGQGTLRFGRLVGRQLVLRVRADLRATSTKHNELSPKSINLHVSHLDQYQDITDLMRHIRAEMMVHDLSLSYSESGSFISM